MVVTCLVASAPVGRPHAVIPLYAEGVVLDAGGMPQIVRPGTPPDDPDAQDDAVQRARQDAWLEEGDVPGPDRYADLAEQALRDLDALVLPNGAAIAGTSAAWRYVWPRDASFTAVALARTGHPDDAFEVLTYLQRMQDERSSGGVFEARYLPDGTGAVPDERGLQLDGNGWVLWAVAQWYDAAGSGAATDEALEELRPLVERSLAAIEANTDPVSGLPGVFPDYWEVRESVPTLGTCAPLLLGVRAAEGVAEDLGLGAVEPLVTRLEAGVDRFAPDYPRRLGGRDRDTAVAFLMPPFVEAGGVEGDDAGAGVDEDVSAAWSAAAAAMVRPAGGLAPGEGWKEDGISWTPTTAVFALTAAASGDVEQAVERLDWLEAHRTSRGALPEKVLWDGSPSAVAPLAWTASLVLLTLDELDRQETGAATDAG